MPAVEYTVSLGASVGTQTGQQYLFMKELRVWGDEIDPSDITNSCYKQVDPSTFDSTYLLAYLRLAQNDYVFDNLAYYTNVDGGQDAPLNSTYDDVTIVYDTEIDFLHFGVTADLSDVANPADATESDNLLVVCPMNSYQFDYSCYNQPVNKFVFSIYPQATADGSSWDYMFSLSDTSMINTELIDDLNFEYIIDDPVLQDWFDNDYDNSINFTIPVSYFKIDNTYHVEVSITNDQQTFYDYVIVDFIPIECFAYYVDGVSAYSLGNEYNQNKGDADISFTITQ
jgi:ferredoxin-like protein FixX